MKVFLIGTFLLLSCTNGTTDTTVIPKDSTATVIQPTASIALTDPMAVRKSVDFDSSLLSKPNELFQWLSKTYHEDIGVLPNASIGRTSKILSGVEIASFGICQVYRIQLTGSFPAMVSPEMKLIYNSSVGRAVLIPFETVLFPKVDKGRALLSTIIEGKGNGYLAIYQFDGTANFKRIFFSLDMPACQGGIPVLNAGLDCVSYEPFLLDYKSDDVNGDGIQDISFVGKVNYYCKGLETNIGRKDRKPLRSEKINITFVTDKQEASFAWSLKDTAICKLIFP